MTHGGVRNVQGQGYEKREQKEKGGDKLMPVFITIDEITSKLRALEADPTMITKDSYSPTGEWPNNRMPFVDYHLAYLRSHKTVDPINYLSNLELMIKKR